MALKCQSCGGTYEPICADGVQYFHACPPLSVPELLDHLEAGTLSLSVVNRARLKKAQEADALGPPADNRPSNVAAFLSTLTIERPNRRDENIAKGATKDEPAQVKSEGAGVTEVSDVTATVDAVVSDVRA